MSTLGKGLESLIPPQKGGGGQGDDAQQSSSPQQNDPQPAAPQPVQQPPEEEKLLPPREEFPEIDPPEEEPLLPPGEEEAAPKVIPLEEAHHEEAQAQPQPQAPSVAPAEAPTRPATPAGGSSHHHRSESVFYLEVDKIRPNEQQPRRHFDDEAISGLAASIREVGIIQPLVVTKIEKEVSTGTQVEYELIAGERRLQAARIAGLERVPAIVRTVDLARDRLELAVIENIQREDLTPIEMARAYARLQDEFRLTQREIAARLGKSREVVANTLRLLDLPGYIQEAVAKGQVGESHARLLLTIDDPAAQQALFHDLLNNNLTTRELRRRTAFVRRKNPDRASAGASPQIKHFEERLASALAAPVKIHPKGQGGNITIDFFSAEELQEILRRLGGGED